MERIKHLPDQTLLKKSTITKPKSTLRKPFILVRYFLFLFFKRVALFFPFFFVKSFLLKRKRRAITLKLTLKKSNFFLKAYRKKGIKRFKKFHLFIKYVFLKNIRRRRPKTH